MRTCANGCKKNALAHPYGRPAIKKFFIFFFLFVLFILPAAGMVGLYVYFSHDLPRIESLKDYAPALFELFERSDFCADFIQPVFSEGETSRCVVIPTRKDAEDALRKLERSKYAREEELEKALREILAHGS